MKQILSISLMASLLFAFTGCGNDWLDDMQPSTSVEMGKSINSPTEAQYAMNGVYSVLRQYEYYGARYTYYGDATGEDMQARSNTKRVAKYYLFELNAVTATSTFWYTPYYAIRNANNVINYADTYTEEEMPDEVKDLKGQALTVRAMGHFDLVKMYGMPYTKDEGASLGVPVVTGSLPLDEKPARNTVAEVYAQIIKDLEEGARYIGKKKDNSRLNWYGNQLVLARAYLYMNNNVKALEVASGLIAAADKDKNYGLVSNGQYKAMWKDENNSEFLFVLINNADEISDSKEFIGYLTSRSGYDDIALSSDYMDLLDQDPDDVRHTIINKYSPKNYRWYIEKYLNPSYQYSHIPVLRLAEAYLIAAEAAVKLGDNTSASKYLNEIVQRANPEKKVEGTVTLQRVLEERRKELVGEGHRLFDAMRNNQTIERKGKSHTSDLLKDETRKFDWNYYKIILPIPRGEMNTNPNMKQNPNY